MLLTCRPVNVPLDIFSEEIQFYELGESAITKFRWVVVWIIITIIEAIMLRQNIVFFLSKSFNNTTSKTVYASGKMKASSRRRRRLCRQMICKGFFIFKLLLSGFVHILYDTIWTQCSFLSIDGSGSCLSTPSPASTPELWPSSPSSLSSSPLWVFPSPLNVTFCF